MFKESKEMKMIRDIRDKHYEETKGMNSKELLFFYKQRSKKVEVDFNKENKIHA